MPQSGSNEGLIRKLSGSQVDDTGPMPASPPREGLFPKGSNGYRQAGSEYTNSNLSADKITVTALPAIGLGPEETCMQSADYTQHGHSNRVPQSPYLQSSLENFDGAGMFGSTRLWFEDSDADVSFGNF